MHRAAAAPWASLARHTCPGHHSPAEPDATTTTTKLHRGGQNHGKVTSSWLELALDGRAGPWIPGSPGDRGNHCCEWDFIRPCGTRGPPHNCETPRRRGIPVSWRPQQADSHTSPGPVVTFLLTDPPERFETQGSSRQNVVNPWIHGVPRPHGARRDSGTFSLRDHHGRATLPVAICNLELAKSSRSA